MILKRKGMLIYARICNIDFTYEQTTKTHFFLKFLTHVWCLSCSVSAPLSIIMIISDHSIPIKLSIKEQGVVGGNIFRTKS